MFIFPHLQEESLKPGKKEKEEEEKLSCNGVEMIREYLSAHTDEDKYVYDVYYTEGTVDNTADFDDFMLDSLGRKELASVGIMPLLLPCNPHIFIFHILIHTGTVPT